MRSAVPLTEDPTQKHPHTARAADAAGTTAAARTTAEAPEEVQPADDSARSAPDPLRRAALLVTLLVVPVVVTLVVLVRVVGGDDNGPSPAQIDGANPTQRANLPPLRVEVPPATPQTEQSCPPLMSEMPVELAGEQARRVDSDTPFAYAWGEPAVVLICGVEQPAGFVTGTATIQINGVQWYVDTSDPDTTVWTAVDRPVYVEVSLPADVDSAPVTALTTHIARALPYQEPTPQG